MTKRLLMLILMVSGLVPTVLADARRAALSHKIQTIEKRVHINPPGANDSRYAYIPFKVSLGATRITINGDYDRANGANVLDFGLFDARFSGRDDDPSGFRGWSGGRCTAITITRDEATPGYTPGNLPIGTWRVCLGLYRVAPEGIDVKLTIVVETKERRIERNEAQTNPTLAPRAANISSSGASLPASVVQINRQRTPLSLSASTKTLLRWFSGDLHIHTVHSDGDWTVAGLASHAYAIGLNFISITDHNTMSHHAQIDRLDKDAKQLLILRGEEVTTYGGHANAWGLPSGAWLDFRVRPGDDTHISAVAAQAHKLGALISINHPFALCKGCNWSYGRAARGFDAIEVWNGAWDATDERALAMWDAILQSGRRITAIGSSDSHRPANTLGVPTTHVATTALSEHLLLAAVRKGRVYVTGEVRRPLVSFEAESVPRRNGARVSIGEELRLKTSGRVRFIIAVEAAPASATVTLISGGKPIRRFTVGDNPHPQIIETECNANAYFRLEIRNEAGAMLAFTNPIYVTFN